MGQVYLGCTDGAGEGQDNESVVLSWHGQVGGSYRRMKCKSNPSNIHRDNGGGRQPKLQPLAIVKSLQMGSSANDNDVEANAETYTTWVQILKLNGILQFRWIWSWYRPYNSFNLNKATHEVHINKLVRYALFHLLISTNVFGKWTSLTKHIKSRWFWLYISRLKPTYCYTNTHVLHMYISHSNISWGFRAICHPMYKLCSHAQGMYTFSMVKCT